ncbi:N-acetyltransferase [Pelomyxa schiedti]|nr:N-acetyltransferase [Pelomyxa schiedti]
MRSVGAALEGKSSAVSADSVINGERPRTYQRKRRPAADVHPPLSLSSTTTSTPTPSAIDCSSSSAAPPQAKHKRTTTALPTAPKKVQLFLDVGQKNFASVTCPECGMVYTPGTEDVSLHDNFHRKHQACFKLKNWKTKANVVKEYHVDGSGIIVIPLESLQAEIINPQASPMIPRSLSTPELLGAKVLQVVEQQLGFENSRRGVSEQLFIYLDSGGRALGAVVTESMKSAHRLVTVNSALTPITVAQKSTTSTESSQGSKDGQSESLEGDGNSITPEAKEVPSGTPACSDVEGKNQTDHTNTTAPNCTTPDSTQNTKENHTDITTSAADCVTKDDPSTLKPHTCTTPTSQQPTAPPLQSTGITAALPTSTTGSEDTAIICHNTHVDVALGISRIWVHEKYRRKGIATKLIDAARSNSVYGCTIPKSKCAFSQPTPDGKKFFSTYTGTPNFYVYDC